MCEQLLGTTLHDEVSREPAAWWDEPEPRRSPRRTEKMAWRNTVKIEQAEFWATVDSTETNLSESLASSEEGGEDGWLPHYPPPTDLLGVERTVTTPAAPPVELEQDEPGSDEPTAVTRTTYAHRGRGASLLNIGKYLSLGGSLDSDRPLLQRFRLPRSRFIARFRLWSEPEGHQQTFTHVRFPPRDFSSHGPRRADGNLLF